MGLAVRAAIATNAGHDSVLEQKLPPSVQVKPKVTHDDPRRLSQLVDNDFPFDESQLAAIEGMLKYDHACLTGAAGTGKTTTLKKFVDELQNSVPIDYVNMKEYFKKGYDSVDDADDYEVPDRFIPAIANVAFTGRATQMIKKNFPRDWHGNIMTIHRLLAFVPERYEDYDDEKDEYVTKMRFVPTYTADCKLPWDIIVIDEAGMVGLDLWNQLLAALKPGCRLYMIGDINQLTPVHGRSIFGFALAKWPAFELTHIHRQKGSNNMIVENAWKVLQGKMPESGGNFQMLKLPGEASMASRFVRKFAMSVKEKGLYDPIRDTIITPINGVEGSRGFMLGQLPLNAEFALLFNPSSVNPRYIIDGGRERKQFAVGDKVMATKNDHESGITNGMTGIIQRIEAHPGYGGDTRRFGTVEQVNQWMLEDGAHDDDPVDFSLEELGDSMDAIHEGQQDKREKTDRGPASHIVTVRFGDDEHGFEIPFSTLSEVGSLMTAYVVTCHKMQGGESPVIVIICHDAHKAMLFREWLYTAITRGSQKVMLLYTDQALKTALGKQKIQGATLKQKIDSFNLLQKDNGMGVALKVSLPEASRLDEENDDAIVSGLDSIRDLVPSASASVDQSDVSDDVRDSEIGALVRVEEDANQVAPNQEKAQQVAKTAELDRRIAELEKRHRMATLLKAEAKIAALWEEIIQLREEKIRYVYVEPVPQVEEVEPETLRVVEPEPIKLSDERPFGPFDHLIGQQFTMRIQVPQKEDVKLLTHQPMKLLTYQPQPVEPPKRVNPLAAMLARRKEQAQ